jgi:hypothetical protein
MCHCNASFHHRVPIGKRRVGRRGTRSAANHLAVRRRLARRRKRIGVHGHRVGRRCLGMKRVHGHGQRPRRKRATYKQERRRVCRGDDRFVIRSTNLASTRHDLSLIIVFFHPFTCDENSSLCDDVWRSRSRSPETAHCGAEESVTFELTPETAHCGAEESVTFELRLTHRACV